MERPFEGFGKYARPELERRFVLADLPPGVTAAKRITDRYLHGSRFRLRRVEDIGGAQHPVLKLGMKIRPDESDPAVVMVTNFYISEGEYELLSSLPADVLVKQRFQLPGEHPTHAVDVFEDELAGLIILEVSFDDLPAMASFDPPDFVEQEVTADDRFSGGALAALDPDDAAALVADARKAWPPADAPEQ